MCYSQGVISVKGKNEIPLFSDICHDVEKCVLASPFLTKYTHTTKVYHLFQKPNCKEL
jgi:hypothetical protein